jgi:hypothetical protein
MDASKNQNKKQIKIIYPIHPTLYPNPQSTPNNGDRNQKFNKGG